MPYTKKSFGVIAICLTACLAVGAPALSQNTAAQSGETCKAPAAQSQNKNGAQLDTDITGSTTLSDCNGVLKPPETGDGPLVKPAPPSSKMPVLHPDDLPAQQQNAK